MISKVTLAYLLLVIVLIQLAEASFTEVPPPPPRPAFFRSKEEMKKYLQKVHEYHAIVGRWRLRRSNDADDLHPSVSTSNNDLFRFLHVNHDKHISSKELAQRLNFRRSN